MTTPDADPADVAEQLAELSVDPSLDLGSDDSVGAGGVPLEAAEADVAEQSVVVEQDDDYR